MDTAQCSIKACINPVVARGWCRKHYGRWSRHGDPTIVKPKGPLRTQEVCDVGSCDRQHYAKGFCKSHYAMQRRGISKPSAGSPPEPVLPPVVVDCPNCGESFEKSATNHRKRFCSRDCKIESWGSSGGQWLAHKKWWLKDRYGITIDEYRSMREAQGGGCAICGKADPDSTDRVSKHSDEFWLHVDHDHATGRVRGLLCGRCNQTLGKMEDNPALLLRAVAYLG